MTAWPNGSNTMPRVSSAYGPRPGVGYSNFHEGVDLADYKDIYSVLPGVVSWAGYFNSNAGHAVCYRPDGFGNRVEILHFHAEAGSPVVSKGQRIGGGQKLARMGQTGNATGPCDHFEIRVDGKHVDPIAWMIANGATGSGAMSVSEAQEFLKSLGLYDGGIDGDPGPKTKGGTRTFQEWVGLVADSIFGPDTSRVARIIIAGEKQVGRSTLEIQQYLQGRGLFHNWAADDDWGNQCSCGTYRLQRAEGLAPDAKWGPATDGRAFPPVPSTPTAPPVTPQLDPTEPWKHQTPDSPLATWVGSPNYGYRAPAPGGPDHITEHWMAGTLVGSMSTLQDPGAIVNGLGTGTSYTYAVGREYPGGPVVVKQFVKEGQYVHSDGNAESNASTISIGHEGGYTNDDGVFVVVDQEVLDKSAELHADIAARHGWGELVWMGNDFPHNHFVATECPGSLDTAYIIAEANRANGHVPAPEPEQPTPTEPKPEAPEEEEPMPEPTEPEELTAVPVPAIESDTARSAIELLGTLMSRGMRNWVYIVYGIIGVILIVTGQTLTAMQILAPLWFAGAVAAYGSLGPFVALIAKANLTPKA